MLSAARSEAAKLAGQQLTLDVNVEWKELVVVELRAWLATRKASGATHMTMEEFRHVAVNHPSSHQSWGAITTAVKNLGLIEFDGYQRAASEKTHSHPVVRWKIL
ncbi:hypothetical protein APR50_10585 [Variovorax paradoxus]|jgi:hypothetical protein|uniref:hypothetical protein n=1 Tax=Variovorax paradoxus TaxID=34073 RepID=UPI0006E4B531|nr:hypothetical protein APR52_20835 [Variovorax paradoxus]KPV08908.1 hypothetical protein APR50_10585 [Variovorax paradoxus]KPV11405.1 hypothetical protein APR49_09460 [Variovorax paradoxus]KPV23297.1 hypothetical protein APR51_08035 [Variovorax paradoxus]KPV31137.1 hypothetical protein APR48_17570 [Variovorax paradoxus]